MLIVCTDHGFMLGEHECWAKCWQPFYEEIAHVPLFVWDPRCAKAGQRRQALAQTCDLAPTILEYFGMQPTKDMLGRSLRDAVAGDAPVRQAGLFGMHGGQVNVTDGRYVYMRGPASSTNAPLFEYTLMPTHMRRTFEPSELAGRTTLGEPFGFTKGCAPMKINAHRVWPQVRQDMLKTLLFDLQTDPRQERPLSDPKIERMMVEHLVREIRACDAPSEQFERLGLHHG
jgi:hypothetical protein